MKTNPSPANADLLRPLAKDLRKKPPRSPRAKLGGYVIAARSLDKCRASLLDVNGEYHYHPCSLAAHLWEFTGIGHEEFRAFVGTGVSDDQVADWLRAHSRVQDPGEIIAWNNRMRDKRISELSPEAQAYLEDYIPQQVRNPMQVKVFFDVFDAEEGRL